jgi:hypothetical protein
MNKTHFDTIDELMELKANIKRELTEQIDNLNAKDEEGNETYGHYRSELDYNDDRTDESISELIISADIDSTEFNIGFEQGIIRGLEIALSHCKKQ